MFFCKRHVHPKVRFHRRSRTAVGQSLAGDHGLGRLWSPMVEQTAEKDIAVIGAAANDPGFDDKGSLVRY